MSSKSSWFRIFRSRAPDVGTPLSFAGRLPADGEPPTENVDLFQGKKSPVAIDIVSMPENSANPAGSAAEAIFNEALGRPSGERAAYVAKACGVDLHLRARVESLLRVHEAPEGFLPEEPGAGPKLDLSKATEEPLPADEKPGDTIGRYKLLERISEGGFGSVYIAEQKEPVKRQVALKIIKLGMNTRQVVARFQAERQALALMDHPSIAKIFDAGVTGDPNSQLSTPNSQLLLGRPYFVMELVQGVKITDYCDQNQLSTRQRLELFTQVCRAVQHAHQKGIIHRDLKPSNILVALRDGQPVPKIIDFGIAKATQAELTEQTVFTQFGHFIGTPAYMSPEQAELTRMDVDTRSDIYSLGVLLYELLTGTTPFETKELLSGGWEEMRRTIKHEEPPRPSTRLGTLDAAALTAIARRRRVEPPKLLHSVRGDLDWIVMKCLEKDRTRRYETANGLATDILRHLNNEPVLARPPSRVYELQKNLRRHKLGFAATAAVMLALSVGVVVSTWEGAQARKAEREAVRAKADATDKLWSSYLAEARARRHSGESGQRFETLAAVSNAAAIRPSPELRNEAIAALALTDVRWLDNRAKHFKHKQEFAIVDPALKRYAVGSTNGTISIRRLSDESEVAILPPVKTAGRLLPWCFSFIPNGNSFVAAYADQRFRFWDLDTSKVVWELPFSGLIFSRDYKTLATIESNNIVIYDFSRRERLKSIVPEGTASGEGAILPDGRRLAYAVDHTNVVVFDFEQCRTLAKLPHSMPILSVIWHPDGNSLVTACEDNLIYVWDAETGQRLRTLEGHAGNPISLDFSRDGRLLASAGWDNRSIIWDFGSGRPLVTTHAAGFISFGTDGRSLIGCDCDLYELQFLELARGREVHTIYEQGTVPGAPGGSVQFSANGRWLVYDTLKGAAIYDLLADREVSSIPGPGPAWVWGFGPGDRSVLGVQTIGTNRVFRLPIEHLGDGGLAKQPMESGPEAIGAPICMSPDRNLCVAIGRGRAQVFRTDTLTEQARTDFQRDMWFAAVSPDDKLLATGAFHNVGVKVWDAGTGKLIQALPTVEEGATAVFSPDGRWLVVGEIGEYQFWEVRTWSRGLRVPRERVFAPVMKFSPDGRILAGTHGLRTLTLYDAADGRVLGELEPPGPWTITSLSFNPDGTQLAIAEGHSALRVWDLRAIREQLALMRLDWDLPPYPSKPPAK